MSFINGLKTEGSKVTARITKHKKTRQKVFKHGTKRQNLQMAREWLVNGKSSAGTISEAWSKYTRYVQSEYTYSYYKRMYKRFLEFYGDHPVEFTEEEIDDYVEWRIGAGVVKSVPRELEALRRITEGSFSIPENARRLSKSVQKRGYQPSPQEFAKTYLHLHGDTRLAVLLALFLGLRCHEVLRLRWDMLGDVAVIPGSIRKVSKDCQLPIVETLRRELTGGEGLVIGLTRHQINNQIQKASEAAQVPSWKGLQKVRSLLCIMAEERFEADTVALVTTHSRKSMVATYTGTTAYGFMDRKLEVLRFVEKRFLELTPCRLRLCC